MTVIHVEDATEGRRSRQFWAASFRLATDLVGGAERTKLIHARGYVMEPDDTAKQQVVNAFQQGVEIAALDNRFVKITQLAMQTVGFELARNVRAGERTSFCIPVQIQNANKVDPAAILVLEERCVIAWSEGTFRPKPYSFAFRLADVNNVETFKRKVGRVSAQLDAIRFVVDRSWVEIILHSEISEDRAAFMLAGVLNGSVSLDWSEDEENS